MSTLRITFIVFALICCATACSKLAYEPPIQDQGVTTIPDPAPAIERIHLGGGIRILMDYTTGCQYIETSYGLVRRMNADGTQYCIDNLNLDETSTDTSTVQSI